MPKYRIRPGDELSLGDAKWLIDEITVLAFMDGPQGERFVNPDKELGSEFIGDVLEILNRYEMLVVEYEPMIVGHEPTDEQEDNPDGATSDGP